MVLLIVEGLAPPVDPFLGKDRIPDFDITVFGRVQGFQHGMLAGTEFASKASILPSLDDFQTVLGARIGRDLRQSQA